MKCWQAGVVCCGLLLPGLALAQSRTLAEVQEMGIKPLTFVEVVELVSGANTTFVTASGSHREWKNAEDGSFVASRTGGPKKRATARGKWSVNEDAALCLSFDWGSMETEEWCRRMYRVDNRYYGFSLKAKPDTISGVYTFSR